MRPVLKAIMDVTQPMTCRVVRASGRCCRCDSRFNDELVIALNDSRVPPGVVFMELRHVTGRRGELGREQVPASPRDP